MIIRKKMITRIKMINGIILTYLLFFQWLQEESD